MKVQKLIIVAYINLSYRVYHDRTTLLEVYLRIVNSFEKCIHGLDNVVLIPVLSINDSLVEMETKLQFVNADNAKSIDTEVIAELKKLAETITHEATIETDKLLNKTSFINKLKMCWSILKSRGFGFLMISDYPITKQDAISTINRSVLEDGEESLCK